MNYEDYEETPWSEDYEDSFHESDYELSPEELQRLKEEQELEKLNKEELYKKKLKESMKEEYEYDEIVGGRDKKPVLSALNKKRLSSFEMDELFNQMG